jgi:peptide/nickel transport system substrate-binding protein
MKADGPETVIFALKGGNAGFPDVVSDYYLPIMTAVDGKADWESGARTGHFIYGIFQPGVVAEFKKNPNY